MEVSEMATTTLTARGADAVAAEFLSALAERDWTAAQSLLDEQVSFHVLTPKGLREASDGDGAISWLTRWFGDADHLDVLKSDSSMLRDRVSISYRFRVHKDA